MSNIDKNRFYKANEEITLRFYQMPKILFNNPIYKGLSLGAKAMYSILRDRQELSISNNWKDEESWVDEEGNIYLVFPIEPKKDDNRPTEEKEARELSLTELLEIDRKTVMNYKKELIKYKLIIDKRMGQGRPSRIYVLKPELPEDNTNETIENYEKSKKGTSRSPNNVHQEVPNFPCNDTEYSDTDFSETIFLSPDNYDEINSPVDTINNERKIESNEIANEFKNILNNSCYSDFEEKYTSALQQAIRLLYYSDKPLKINSMSIPPSQVREDLKLLRWKHLDLALRDYQIQAKKQEIQFPVGYLSRCIYNAIFQGDLRIESDLLYNDLI